MNVKSLIISKQVKLTLPRKHSCFRFSPLLGSALPFLWFSTKWHKLWSLDSTKENLTLRCAFEIIVHDRITGSKSPIFKSFVENLFRKHKQGGWVLICTFSTIF